MPRTPRTATPDQGTAENPVRYEELDRSAPDFRERFEKQLDQAEKDANAGKCICLSDLMGNSGM